MSIATSGTHTAAVTGTSSVNGNFSPSVTIHDASGQSFTGNYSLTVAAATGAPVVPYEIRLYSQGAPASGWNSNQPLQNGSPYTISNPNTQCIQVPSDASPTATSFNIRRSTDNINWTVLSNAGWSGRIYTDTTPNPCVTAIIGTSGVNFAATTYFYQVQAVNASGVSGWSPTQSIYLYLGNSDGAYGASRYLLWDDTSLLSGTTTVNNDTSAGSASYNYGDPFDCLVSQHAGYWLPAVEGPFVRWLCWGGAVTGAAASGTSAAGGYLNFDFKQVTPNSGAVSIGLQWHCVATQSGGDETLLVTLPNIAAGSSYIVKGSLTPGNWASLSIPIAATGMLKDSGGVTQPALYKITVQIAGGSGSGVFAVTRFRYSPTKGP
jgi:hypothetical protein